MVIPVTNPDIDVDRLVQGYRKPFEDEGMDFELVFVLDGVRGALARELDEMQNHHPIKVVHLQGSGLGESIALSAGVARARGELILNAPPYIQCEPDDLIKVVQALQSGADFVTTWRHPRVDPWLNRLQSRVFNWCLRILMGIRFHDLNSGLRGMRRQVVQDVSVYGEMYRFLPVLAERQGFNVVEVKVRHREEKGRQGFYGVGVYLRRILDILTITFLARFRQKPLRFFGMLGFLSILVGMAMVAEPLYDRWYGESLQDRPIFVLGIIALAFGVQLIGFGLVAEIIIFTQSGSIRDYKLEDLVEGGLPPVEEADQDGPSESYGDAPMRVRELLPGEDARWDGFVRRHPHGSIFHLSGWRRCVEETFHHVPHDLVVEQGRRWLGVLPLMHVKSMFVGEQLISIPYAVYGGILTDSEEAQELLLEAAQRQGKKAGAGYVELRHLEERPGRRMKSDLYVTFRKDLPSKVEEVLPGIPKRARAEVRRAVEKHQMTFEQSEDYQSFYELFSDDKRRLGSPPLPYRWFCALREEFGRQIVLHMVRDRDGKPAAAVMSFAFQGVLYAYYSGSRFDLRGCGVNNFIYCRMMEWAVNEGFQSFDFGRSRKDTGAASFKQHMGFEAESLSYEYLMLRDDATMPDFNPSNPALSTHRRIWSNLPRFVTRRLGGRLSRYLP